MQAGERLDVVNVGGGGDPPDLKAEATQRLGGQHPLAKPAPVLPVASGRAAQAIGAGEASARRSRGGEAGWRSAKARRGRAKAAHAWGLDTTTPGSLSAPGAISDDAFSAIIGRAVKSSSLWWDKPIPRPLDA